MSINESSLTELQFVLSFSSTLANSDALYLKELPLSYIHR